MSEPDPSSDPPSDRTGAKSLARLRALFDAAIDLPTDARARWIADHVVDARDRVALERLLASADANARGFLDTPVDDHAGSLEIDDSALAEKLVGRRIGAFRLVRLIGKGGMAAVFLGTREGGDFRQNVAIKLLRRGLYSELEQRLFLRERQVLASLDHPNIARLIDGGVSDAGLPFLVMEYVDGATITHFAESHALDFRARLALFFTVCRAVEAAHRALIVHRDIKPSNILVAADGTVKLLDFGIAKLLEDNIELGTVGIFTPEYAAPEQLAAQSVTTATDVYALGVLLHELLLGVRPGADGATRRPSTLVMDGVTEQNAAAASALRRRLRGDLDNVIMKALAPEPEQRYASAGAFADDIERHLGGRPVAAHPPSRLYRARKFVARHRGSVVTTAALVLAIFAALGVALWQASVAREQARVAREEAQRADAVQSFLVGVFDSNSSYQDDPVRARATTAEQLLALGKQKIDGAMNDAPDAKVRMLMLLAQLHDGLGLDDEAAALYRKSIDVAHAAHGPEALAAFESQIALADELHSANSDEDAKSVLDAAEATLEANADQDPRRRAMLLDQLSEYYATRDPQRALGYSTESVALFDAMPAPTFEHAFALSRLARADVAVGRDADAMRAYRRAIAISTEVDGDKNPDLVRYYAELAELQTRHHDIAGGEESGRKALAAAKALHGENHVDVAQCEVRLGRLLFDSDRTTEGFALMKDARTHIIALRGPGDGFHTPHLVYQLGTAEVQRGDIEDGLANIDDAIANRRRERPGTLPLAQFLEAAANARVDLGAHDEAARDLDEAEAIRAKAGQKTPSAAFDADVTARIRLDLSRHDVRQAKARIAELSTNAANADPLDRQTLLGHLTEGDVELADGDTTAALATARAVRRTIEGSAIAPYSAQLISQADFIEGVALLRSGDARAAEPFLGRALAERRRNLDAKSPRIGEAELMLAEASLAEGDTDAARQHASEAERIDATHARLGPLYSEPLASVVERACSARSCVSRPAGKR